MPRPKRVRTTPSEAPAKTAKTAVAEKGNGHAVIDVEAAIRARAYQLYEQRGRQDGFAQDDWLQAEAEVLAQSSKRTA